MIEQAVSGRTSLPRPPAFAEPVAADLRRVEEILAENLSAYNGPLAPMVAHLRHYQGKRLRPALLLLAAKACGAVTHAHHVLAAVLEMIHTATLVHDDVLDESELRRHAPTVNRAWGTKASVLLGDLLFTRAFHLSSTLGDAAACERIGEATNRVCAGEMHQVCERGNLDLGEETYLEIVEGKTAALTECAGRLGACYAGADPAVCDALAEYGRCLGIAFQITDDVIDLVGDEQKAGKTLGTDLAQRKLTLPLIHLLRALPAAEAAALRDALRNGAAGPGGVRQALERAGSVAYARARADGFARQARECLAGLGASEAKRVLEAMTGWAVRRER